MKSLFPGLLEEDAEAEALDWALETEAEALLRAEEALAAADDKEEETELEAETMAEPELLAPAAVVEDVPLLQLAEEGYIG